jgi:ATP-dependent DNA helicase RecQ
MHKEWGKGVVEAYEGGRITVLFDDAGRKTLALAAVVENSLLEPAA